MKKIVFIFFLLTSCAKNPPIIQNKIVYIKPSPLLLEPITVPPFTGTTNDDLLQYMLNLEQKIHICNTRLKTIKETIQ